MEVRRARSGSGPRAASAAVPVNVGRGDRWRPGLAWGSSIVALALVFTLLNAFKPLVIDDTAFFYCARQIAADPADPYGYEIFWSQRPEPAPTTVSPLLPYWWAGAMALFGDRPVLWKLSLLPFALVLAFSLHRLLSRFARGVETPLLWMSMLLPMLLPNFNLMLDIPALALGLLAVVVFLRACDESRGEVAALAGLLAGLAIQTKFTGVMAAAAAMAYAVIFRKWALGLVAGTVAALVFCSWEAFAALRYGESHFLNALRWVTSEAAPSTALWSLGLVSILGATAPGVALLGLVALRARAWVVLAATIACSLAFGVLPALPAATIPRPRLWPDIGSPEPELWVFVVLGSFVVATAIAVSWSLVGRQTQRWSPRCAVSEPTPGRANTSAAREDLFLVVWLVIEIVGFYGISPFLAVRRLMGFGVVLTLVIGRALTRTPHGGASLLRIWLVASWSIALGLLFCLADLSDALAQRRAVSLTNARLGELEADRELETIWYVGHWGFQFYAERHGMQPLVPGESLLRRGDWLIIPSGVYQQRFGGSRGRIAKWGLVSARSRWPWSTLPSAYQGAVPVRGQYESQIRVSIYRVESDFVPHDPTAR